MRDETDEDDDDSETDEDDNESSRTRDETLLVRLLLILTLLFGGFVLFEFWCKQQTCLDSRISRIQSFFGRLLLV